MKLEKFGAGDREPGVKPSEKESARLMLCLMLALSAFFAVAWSGSLGAAPSVRAPVRRVAGPPC